jgi:hypothetical protein
VDPYAVAQALLGEAREVYPEADVFEKTASCPALINAANLRFASYVGPFSTPEAALQKCFGSPLFQRRGCYAAQLRVDQVPTQREIDTAGVLHDKDIGYLARADGWMIYDEPDQTSTAVGSTDYLYQVLKPICQRVGRLFEFGPEASNIWNHIDQPVDGWISDMGVIGTPTDGLDARLPICD